MIPAYPRLSEIMPQRLTGEGDMTSPRSSDTENCAGSGGAPSGLKSGKGLTGQKIGECPICYTWHMLSGGSIPPHRRGEETYKPFPTKT